MAPTAPPATPVLASRFGDRPAKTETATCGHCGHPYAMHGNGETPCRAYACTAGPHDGPCQGYTEPEQALAS